VTDYSIRYRFTAVGQADVVRAYGSIAQAAARANAAEAKAADSVARGQDKAMAARQRASGSAYRDNARLGREADRAASAEERAARRAADARMREETRARKHVAGIRDRYFLQEQRQQERAEDRARQRRAQRIGAVGTFAVGALGMAGNAAMGAIGAGALVVGAASRKEFALRDKTMALARDTRMPGQDAANSEQLAREFQRTALASPGQTAEGIANAVKAFTTKTGNLDMARALQGTMATASNATGADITEISGAAADLMQKFDIRTVDGMREAMAKLIVQGKKGAFELKDAAAEFPAIASAAQRFGLDKGVKGVSTLGGLMQIAREATPSGAEASTAVEMMFTQLVAKSGKLKDAEFGGKSVRVFDDKGNARDIQDVLVETIANVGGDDMEAKKQGLQKVFDIRGIRAISPLIDTFATAVRSGTDPVKAMRDKLRDAIDTTAQWSDIQQDAAMTEQTSSAKLAAAWESLSSKVGDQVVPHVAKMIDAVAKTPGAFDALAGTAGVLAEAFVGLINFLKTIPGVKELLEGPPKGTGDMLTDAAAEVDAANKPLAMGRSWEALTPEEQGRINKANERYASLAMVSEIQEGAVGTASEDEVMSGLEQIGGMGGLTAEEKSGRQAAIVESFNRGRGEDQQIRMDEASNAIVGSADALKEAAKAQNDAAAAMKQAAGSLGDGRGDPLGGGGRRF
jgi:hypothetical protein